MMVQHLEREMELNGLAAPEMNSVTGIHNIETIVKQEAQSDPNKVIGLYYGCGKKGHLLKHCRKVQRDNRRRQQRAPTTNVTPCETCGKKSHETKDCVAGANWANRPTWWKSPQLTGTNTVPLNPQNNQPETPNITTDSQSKN